MSPRFTLFFYNDPATTEIYTLSLHDALPICLCPVRTTRIVKAFWYALLTSLDNSGTRTISEKPIRCIMSLKKRSEEHTSELQSHVNLVCRLLLEKKKTK